MKNLLDPKWIFLINTLPILLMSFLYLGEFAIIKSLLNDENIRLWKIFGLTLVGLGLLNVLYAVYTIVINKKVSVWYGTVSLICHILFIYAYIFYAENIILFNIPQWMLSDNITLYVGTFLMPSLAYSLFIIVTHFTPEYKKHTAWKNFLIAVAIPVSWYLFFLVIAPLWKPVSYNYNIHAIIIFVIIGTLIFLFFLIKGMYILVQRNNRIWAKYELVWKIPLCIILPLLGLMVNNGHFFNDHYSPLNQTGVLGNFNNIWFYIIALANGILLCLPSRKNKNYRLSLFIARSITLAYTFYFFIVFLPFLPISVIAIIALGSGFLMLVPLVLFIVHVQELTCDFNFLKNVLSRKVIIIVSVLSFLVIPAAITVTYLKDKNVLTKTLNYIYSPDYSKEYNIDEESLKNTLQVIEQHKNNEGFFGMQTPYLSTYFKWLVLDNLTLSDSKIKTIESIFFGEVSPVRNRQTTSENIQNSNVDITNISTKSTFDEINKSWTSWIDLEITNASESSWAMEYVTTISLPTGCWINDYYLYVNDKKEKGILAEKKTAMWVFSQIRNEKKDPGILYYLTGNEVAFRIFPFLENEVRKTGIQFIHKEPVVITIDGHDIELGKKSGAIEKRDFENDYSIYVSSDTKRTLKQTQRKPYFHFIVDVSKNMKTHSEEYIKKIEALKKTRHKLFNNARISFTNSYSNTYFLEKEWKENYKKQLYKGGFYLDRAIKKILMKTYLGNDNTYPVIVVVTDSIENAILNTNFLDYKIAYPETDHFYILKDNDHLEIHSLTSDPIKKSEQQLPLNFNQTTLEYRQENNTIAYLPNNNEASIILKRNPFNSSENNIKKRNWESGLVLQAMWTTQIMQPEIANTEWLNMIKYSFLSKIMTPVTSYLVVENEAQKAILKKKQEQVLSGNKSLDLDEDTPRMSEPSLFILFILLGLFLLLRKKYKNYSLPST